LMDGMTKSIPGQDARCVVEGFERNPVARFPRSSACRV
jgi:hypothetical protein